MSCPEDKQNEASTPGRATCELKHLRVQFGYRVLAGAASLPLRVEVAVPGYLATWRRLPGTALYEREPDTHPTTREEA